MHINEPTNQFSNFERNGDGVFGDVKNNYYITIKDIDTFLSREVETDFIRVGSIRQNEFNYLIEHSEDRFKGFNFHNLHCVDISILSTLSKVEVIKIDGSRIIKSLWNMYNNTRLKALELTHMSQLRDIGEVTTAQNLVSLIIDFGVWESMTINSLKPLRDSSIEYLWYSPKKLLDLDFSFLLDMEHLKYLEFPLNFHTTEEIAWIKSRMPHIKGWSVKPYVEFKDKISIVGKRKPFIKKDETERLNKYILKFNNLVQKYKTEDVAWRNK